MSLLVLGCIGLDSVAGSAGCDADADGYEADACVARAAVADCDDRNGNVYPGAFEACDGLDNDCSGVVDDTVDGDGDGVYLCFDCDDSDATVFPGAEEACDGVDNDCSGAADEPFDADGDGVSPCGGDCDDGDPLNAAGLSETCDGRDNDCDGSVDEGFDADGDGWLTCRGDCDDANATIYYGAAEGCDGLDNDCDGVADDVGACWGCVDIGGWLWCPVAAEQRDAGALCGEFGSGLVEPVDSGTNSAISAALAAAGGGVVWIGLHDRGDEGVFVWESGTPVGFTAWAPGQPDDADGEDCVTFDAASYGAWADVDCDFDTGFVCAY